MKEALAQIPINSLRYTSKTHGIYTCQEGSEGVEWVLAYASAHSSHRLQRETVHLVLGGNARLRTCLQALPRHRAAESAPGGADA